MSRPRLGNAALTVGRADAQVNTQVAAIQHQHATSRGGVSESLRAVPVALLTRSPWQPRTRVDTAAEGFTGLVASIQAHGVLEPLLARELDAGGLELLAGERRLEAAKAAGLDTVPVRVLRGLSDTDAQEVALVENLAREGLTPWEEAQGLAALADALERAGRGVTVRGLAHLAGRSRSAVARALQIARHCTPAVHAEAVRQATAGAVPELGTGAVPTWDTLPGSVLETVAKGATVADRAAVLLRLAAPYRPSSPTAPAPTRKPRDPAVTQEGWTMAGTLEKRVAFRLTRPVDALAPAEAAAALEALAPLVRALKRQAKGTP